MVRDLLPQHKKAVSELVSYVLLIIIAIAASVIVFNFLKLETPKDKPFCQEGVSLSISDYSCTYIQGNTELFLSITNNGKFTVEAAYIRVGGVNQKTKVLINYEDQLQFYFYNKSEKGIAPGGVSSKTYIISDANIQGTNPITAAGQYALEIQPAVYDPLTDKLAACDNAIITQTISCLSP